MFLKSVVVCLLALSAVAQAAVEGGQTTVKRKKVAIVEEDSSPSDLGKNVVAFELLGRGLLYGVSYDRMISENVALGMGYSNWSAGSQDFRINFNIIPVYANYYFQPGSHRGYISGGAELISAKWDFDSSISTTYTDAFGNKRTNAGAASGVAPIVGGGYEYRGDGGFLFRATGYLLVAAKTQPWFGLTFGGAF